MLETIRDYAAERLDEQPEVRDAARLAHAEYFADVAQERRERLKGGERPASSPSWMPTSATCSVAWRYWVEVGDLGDSTRCSTHCGRCTTTGLVSRRDRALERPALCAVDGAGDGGAHRPEISVRTSLARGLMAIRGYTQEVEDIYAAVLTQVEETGEPSDALPLLRSLASLYLYRGDFDKGHRDRTSSSSSLPNRQRDPALQAEGHLRIGTNSCRSDAWTKASNTSIVRSGYSIRSSRRRAGCGWGQPGDGALHDVRLRALVDRASCARDRAWCGCLAHRGGTASSVQRGVRALPRGVPRRVAKGLGERDERASQVLDIAEEHDYQVWRALAHDLPGRIGSGGGQSLEGMALSDQGMPATKI